MNQVTDILAFKPFEESDPTGTCTLDVQSPTGDDRGEQPRRLKTASIEDVDVSEDVETATAR
jgi:hypothetical protein